jgi:hypothetical protein
MTAPEPRGVFAATDDPARLDVLADELVACAAQFEDLAGVMRARMSRITENARWTGKAADACREFCDGSWIGPEESGPRLRRIAAEVRTFANEIEKANGLLAQAAHMAANATALSNSIGEVPAHEHLQSATAEFLQEDRFAASAIRRQLEQSEPDWEKLRFKLDSVLAPVEVLGTDWWAYQLGRAATKPQQFAKEAGSFLESIHDIETRGPKQLREVTRQWEELGARVTTWVEDAPALVKFTAAHLPAFEAGTKILGGLGIVSDVGTLIKPEDSGTVGYVDRIAAVGNAGVGAAEILGASVSGGPVILTGTAVYLGGDFLYHHWKPFHNVCDDVGHGTVSLVKGGWHAVTSIGGLFG